MTQSEFVRLSVPEQKYGESHLLSAQLELLNLIKSFHKFKELRNEELVLKVTLKAKVEEMLEQITKLEKLIPKANYKEATPEDRDKERKKQERKLSLQEEIERVREKLAKLRGSGL